MNKLRYFLPVVAALGLVIGGALSASADDTPPVETPPVVVVVESPPPVVDPSVTDVIPPTGMIGTSTTNHQAPGGQSFTPAPQHLVFASCKQGVKVELNGYPRKSTIQINGGPVVTFHGDFKKTTKIDQTKDTNWLVKVTVPEGKGAFEISGLIKACVAVAHPQPPVVCKQGEQLLNGKCVTPAARAVSNGTGGSLAFTGITPLTRYAAVGGVSLPLIGGLMMIVFRKKDELVEV